MCIGNIGILVIYTNADEVNAPEKVKFGDAFSITTEIVRMRSQSVSIIEVFFFFENIIVKFSY